MLSTMINTTLYILLKNNLLTLYVGIYNYAIYLVAPYGVKSISTTAQQKEKKKENDRSLDTKSSNVSNSKKMKLFYR